jgi:microcystin-dependent protein
MAKTKISEFDSTPANNTDIDSINIAEGCAPSGINNAIRELMSQLKDQQTGASGDNFTVGGNLAVTGTSTFTGIASAPTASVGTNTTQVATTAFVASAIPTGVINMWGTGTAPSGWLLCAGAAVSRSTYATLFAVIGTTFGVGDGSTTFNLPNYTNRMPYGTTLAATGGSATTTLATTNLPSHTHPITDPGHAHNLTTYYNANIGGTAINSYADTTISPQNNPTQTATTGITATDATGSGTAVTTISPYLGINFIIKT